MFLECNKFLACNKDTLETCYAFLKTIIEMHKIKAYKNITHKLQYNMKNIIH